MKTKRAANSKGEYVGVRVTAEMKRTIDETADGVGHTASDLMREFVELYWPVFADGKRFERAQKLRRLEPPAPARDGAAAIVGMPPCEKRDQDAEPLEQEGV